MIGKIISLVIVKRKIENSLQKFGDKVQKLCQKQSSQQNKKTMVQRIQEKISLIRGRLDNSASKEKGIAIKKATKLKKIVILCIATLILAVLVSIYIYRRIKKAKKSRKDRQEQRKSKQSLRIRNASFRSIKQYESHSESDVENHPNLVIKEVDKKVAKDLKQYCTDIDSEANKQKSKIFQEKKDNIFFHLMRSYKHTGEHKEINSEDQYECQYEYSPQLAPRKIKVQDILQKDDLLQKPVF